MLSIAFPDNDCSYRLLDGFGGQAVSLEELVRLA
jgi:hypothetical protein